MKYIQISGILILYLCSSCNEDDIVQEPQLPVSNFTYSGDQDSNGKLSLIPVTIAFQNISEFTDSVHWDFGDGETSKEENPQHIYTENGSYTVSLIAMNTDGSDTSNTEISIGVESADMVIATAAEGVTVFSLEYDLSDANNVDGTSAFFLELSTYSDFSQMVEFTDENFQLPIAEKELSGTGTYQFKELKPGSWYYYRIRQELTLDGHTYSPFYSEVKTARLGSLLAPSLSVATYAENACIMKFTASINEPPGESLNLTGDDVQISVSYAQNLSNPISLDVYNSGTGAQGDSFYVRRPGSTIFARGVYEYKGRMAYSSVISYTTDDFIANFSTNTFSGATAEIGVGTTMVVIGDQTGKHIRFLVPDYVPNTLDTYSILHSSFEYEDETGNDYNVINSSEFHDKVVLKILEESDTHIIAQLVNNDNAAVDIYYALEADVQAEIFLSGLIFKAEKVQ